jgi:hypothetical protein
MRIRFSLLLILASPVMSPAADAVSLCYEVVFKGAPVATQTVTLTRMEGLTRISTDFKATLPVFVTFQPYSEELSVSSRPDGTVVQLAARRIDGGQQVEITGELEEDGRLRVIRNAPGGVTTNWLLRSDYDFHSLVFYGTAPTNFLSTNQPARVLSVADGRVEPVAIQVISESDTFERQHLSSAHLIWTAGPFTSHSWHPERFSDLPRRYVRQTENGEFTFTLQR